MLVEILRDGSIRQWLVIPSRYVQPPEKVRQASHFHVRLLMTSAA